MNLPKVASISKKIVVACVGLFLALFLLVHLGINLCLLRPDHGAWFTAAANFMGTNYVVKVFEIVLMMVIFVHIVLTIAVQIQNWKARPVRYHECSKTKTSPMSKYMIWTGGLIVCFLLLHFMNFYFVKIGWVEGEYMIKTEKLITPEMQQEYLKFSQGQLPEAEAAAFQEKMTAIQSLMEKAQQENLISPNAEWINRLTPEDIAPLQHEIEGFEPDFYHMSINLFQNKAYSIVYIILFIVLGFHLVHAFQSSFQTLGLNHNKYNCFIKACSWIYSICIAVGFSIIPIYFMFFYK